MDSDFENQNFFFKEKLGHDTTTPSQDNSIRGILPEEIINETIPTFPGVIADLKKLYNEKIRPVEEKYMFDSFHSPSLRDADFDAKPIVLLIGQYSTGKTSFIEYLLERQYPGQRIGPEPTTDRFVAVVKGNDNRVIPGNALSMDVSKPFYALNNFGTAFLSKFEAAELDSPILDKVMFIDTPGVLSGEKQRIGRSYDFVSVCEWFAERADMILLLFDAHKLDISDEFKRVIMSLKGQDDKIRVVLNKADQVSSQQLMRVYGALMWSLGKVVATPEVMRVYIGSFRNQPYKVQDVAKLFRDEQRDLLLDLHHLPRNSAIRKINEIVKRARLVRTHAYIISNLKKKMPSLFGKSSKKAELIANLGAEFREVSRVYGLPSGDFPDLKKYAELLQDHEFDKFPKLDEKQLTKLEEVLTLDIPRLMSMIAPVKENLSTNPFDEVHDGDWSITYEEALIYNSMFEELCPVKGKLSGSQAKQTLIDTGVSLDVLKKVWDLSDVDRDGYLDKDEFSVAMYLCQAIKVGKKLPTTLPEKLVPPSKRSFVM